MDSKIKSILKLAILITSFIFIFGLITQNKALYVSVTAGCIVSILNFYLIYRDAIASVKSGSRAFRITFSGYLKRYLLYGVVLFLSIRVNFQWFIGTFLGFFLVKFLIIIEQVMKLIKGTLTSFIKKIKI